MGTVVARPDCEAVEIDGIVQCERCGVGWRAGGERKACFPIVTYSDMWAAILHERLHYARWQKLRIAEGRDLTPDQADRMAALAAAMRMISLIADNTDLQDEIVIAVRALRGAANGK
jgi:hypothetical protein